MLQIIISKYWIQILVGIKAEYYFEYSLQNYSITRPCNMRLQHAPSGEAALLYLHFCISYSANRKEPSADSRVPPWTRDTPFGKLRNNCLVWGSCLFTPWVPFVLFTTWEARGWCYIFFDMHCQCCSTRYLKSVCINDKATFAHGHAGIIMEWNSDAKIKEFKISHYRA